MIIDYLFVLV